MPEDIQLSLGEPKRSRGGKARMQKLSAEERKSLATTAARKRWSQERVAQLTAANPADKESHDPAALARGILKIGESEIPCYVLDNVERDRVFSMKGVVVGLIGTEGGQLAEYIKVENLRPFLPKDLIPAGQDNIPALIKFDTGGKAPFRYALGLRVEKFMDLCAAYSLAAEKAQLTDRQAQIATNANRFLRACAKVGIVALVDEATGYQEQRPIDELQFKLNLFLEESMRKWEKTFPDELWVQFGRLTGWAKPAHQRPKYWGHLVFELVYKYLDPDVAQWLHDNAPKPKHGQNYHQWLTGQYGLQRLIEHVWKLIGVASTCSTMDDLRYRMKELYGNREPFQYRLQLFNSSSLPAKEESKRLAAATEP